MFSINNQLYVSIKVGTTLLPIGGGQLKELVLTEAVDQFLPTIEFTFIDKFGLLFSEPAIHDGKVISVAIATTQSDLDSSWRQYIVYPRQVLGRHDGFEVSVVGFLNSPEYLIGGAYGSFEGNSSDIAKTIADECGLDSDVDPTNDNQVWLLTGQSRAKFLKGVANHAFADTRSAYVCFVNRDGELHFVDVSKRRSNPSKWTFKVASSLANVEADEKTFLVPETEFASNFSSDILNASGGYGIVFRQYDFTSGKELFSTPRDYSSFTRYMNVNQDIKGLRFEYSPPQVGNTHKNYALAKFQNFRNRALYSVGLQCVVPIPRKVASLFDRAQFLYYDRTKNQVGSVLGGVYFVERIVQTISSSSFVVTYGLVREGFDSDVIIAELGG